VLVDYQGKEDVALHAGIQRGTRVARLDFICEFWWFHPRANPEHVAFLRLGSQQKHRQENRGHLFVVAGRNITN
jgi:hypothetical protein